MRPRKNLKFVRVTESRENTRIKKNSEIEKNRDQTFQTVLGFAQSQKRQQAVVLGNLPRKGEELDATLFRLARTLVDEGVTPENLPTEKLLRFRQQIFRQWHKAVNQRLKLKQTAEQLEDIFLFSCNCAREGKSRMPVELAYDYYLSKRSDPKQYPYLAGTGLKRGILLFLWGLQQEVGQNKSIFASTPVIADRFGIANRSTPYRALKELEAEGYIKTTKLGNGYSATRYRVLISPRSVVH